MIDFSQTFSGFPLGTTPGNPYYQPPSTTNPQYPSIPNPFDNLVSGIEGGLVGALSIFLAPAIIIGVMLLILVALVVGFGGFTFGLVLGDES